MCGLSEHRVALDGYEAVPTNSDVEQIRIPKNAPWKMLLYSVGIFVSYAIFGLLQEYILKERFGPKDEQFDYMYSLLLVQCMTNAIVAKILIIVLDYGTDHTKFGYYLTGSGFYLGGMLASVMALRYINYPTQIIAKSAKPLPVMALGVIFSRRRYSLLKCFCVSMIVFGVTVFMYNDNHPNDSQDSGLTYYGNILLVISLLADGLLCVVQDKMQFAHETKALHMMYKNNLFSVIFLLIGMFYVQELVDFAIFVNKYPRLYIELIAFALTSAVGQLFIYSTIVDFGPLVCAIVTTVRKFVTVIFSVLIFGSTISLRQWLAAILVFSGIILDALSA